MPFKKTQNADQYSLKAKLERFSERYAILRIEGHEMKWPIKHLPDDIAPGEEITVSIKTKDLEKNEQYEHMRSLLEKLIN